MFHESFQHQMCIPFKEDFQECIDLIDFFTGEMQQRKTPMQVLPSSTTSQGPASHKR